jgi:hypothetical protein
VTEFCGDETTGAIWHSFYELSVYLLALFILEPYQHTSCQFFVSPQLLDRRFANLFSYIEPASWVSRGTPDTSDLPLAQRDHITVRSRWPVCYCIRSNLFIFREEARLRSRPTACQYPYRRKANPSRANTWWQPQIPCSPSRIGQLLMGF